MRIYKEQTQPCEGETFCPPRRYHQPCSYTSSHPKLEDCHEDCKTESQEESSQEARQAV